MQIALNPKIKDIFEWIYCIIIAFLLALLVRHYIATPTIVKQPSMYPTLVQDQRLILNRLAITTHEDIKRGDIVTFEAPSKNYISAYEADLSNPVAEYENEHKGILDKFNYYILETSKISYIKRVIGLPGEHVKIKDGKVYINNKELKEEYLKKNVITDSLEGAFTDLIVPDGYVFLLGDNRRQSTDCRRFGCIPIEKIESKVGIRFWPLNLFGKV